MNLHRKLNEYFYIIGNWSEMSYKILAFDKVNRSSPSEMFLEKGVLKICRKFIGEHPYQSAIVTLKLHLSMGVLLKIFCIFSVHLFLRTSLKGVLTKTRNDLKPPETI